MHRPNPATKRRCARVHPTGAGVGRRRGFVPYRLDSSPHRRRGWTQDEIAESEGMTHGPVTAILSDFPILENQTKSHQTLATYSEPDWTPPIYNPTPFLPEFYLSLARIVHPLFFPSCNHNVVIGPQSHEFRLRQQPFTVTNHAVGIFPTHGHRSTAHASTPCAFVSCAGIRIACVPVIFCIVHPL